MSIEGEDGGGKKIFDRSGCYSGVMPRTEIELTEEEARRLDEVAASKGQSVAEIVRESVREYLGKTNPHIDRALAKQCALDAIGKFRSSVNDLGSNHDRYLEEDFAD